MSFQPSLKFWNGVAIAAILALIATLAADYAFPKPTFRSRTEAKNKADNQAREQAYALAQDFEKQRTEIEARVWKESSDSVGAQTLDKATNMARAHALNLTAFRPQKPDEQTGVEIEAMTACAVACLTIYDMCKSAEKGIVIDGLKLMRKSGGKSGTWERAE